MILSRRAALGGVQLDELHEAIVIRSLDPGIVHETTNAVSRMGGTGQRVTGEHFDTLEATVTYAIDLPKRQMAERKAVYDSVIAWANRKGWLTFDHMPNRRLRVDKVVWPGGGDMWDWLNEYTLTFRAYNVPFWQEETPTQAVIDLSAGGNVYVDVNGNTGTVLDVTFENRSGMEIPDFSVTAGDSSISLSGMGLGGGQTLRIHHGTDGLLRIQIGNRSVYEKHTGSDDLYVNPGRTRVGFSATRAGRFTVQSYGRFIG